MDKPTDLEDGLVDFAVRIINVVETLPSLLLSSLRVSKPLKKTNDTSGALFNSRSSYFTNQQSPIVNHQSTERACRFGAKRHMIIDATIDRRFPIFCCEPEPTSGVAANPLGKH